jgi:hypothetical protein
MQKPDKFLILNKHINAMKKITLFGFVCTAVLFVAACTGGKKETVAVNNDEWPEMDEFHMIMAESFHPYKDSANVEPAKANAAEMAKLAEKWLNAPLPEKVNTDDVKATLVQLKTDADAFTQLVQTSDSVKIGESLTSLHDVFHKLQESWYGGKKDEHADHAH